MIEIGLESPAFASGGSLPRRHARAGLDLSPPLVWTAPPPETRAFALLVEDPDAPGGTFAHWSLYDLPPTVRALPEGTRRARHLPDGSRQGRNDYGGIGYGGPAPPPGEVHRYFFQLFALCDRLGLSAGASALAVRQLLGSRTTAYGELVATYGG